MLYYNYTKGNDGKEYPRAPTHREPPISCEGGRQSGAK